MQAWYTGTGHIVVVTGFDGMYYTAMTQPTNGTKRCTARLIHTTVLARSMENKSNTVQVTLIMRQQIQGMA
jgi:hypothetical protein